LPVTRTDSPPQQLQKSVDNEALRSVDTRALQEIDAFFGKSHSIIIPLTVREILDEQIARRPA